jgi:6-phosphogluconolactonase
VTAPRVFAAPEPLARAAAVDVAGALRAAIAARGRATLMLCGGRTPVPLYQALAALATGHEAGAPDWRQVQVYLTDERAVPADDPARNERMIRATLADPAGIPAAQVHGMPADRPDLDAAARDYETRLPETLDLVILGLGDDAHVASLFPGSPWVAERVRRVAAVEGAPRPPGRRLTVTPPVLEGARRVFVLATGSGKADAVARVLAQDGPAVAAPGRLVRDREWYVDREAARALSA